jgi:uncharacterized protein YndB with AHSA1/START domain
MGRVKIEMEFEVRSSPTILFNHIATASGLEEWFADKVNVNGKNSYSFFWDGKEEAAELVKKTPKTLVKFRWIDGPSDEFFQMEIIIDDLTSDVVLVITDFADEDEVEETEMLWESQVDALKSYIGA